MACRDGLRARVRESLGCVMGRGFDRVFSSLSDEIVARVVAELRERDGSRREDGYLAPEGAAAYMGVSRKRVHDLTSMGALVPDGRDGRTPLFTRETLDAYVRSDSP